jgi:hypothetical protein
MKTTKSIRAYILQCGHKRTNAEMATRLNVPRMSFAGVLAALKRNDVIGNNFLATDLASKRTKRTNTKKVTGN